MDKDQETHVLYILDENDACRKALSCLKSLDQNDTTSCYVMRCSNSANLNIRVTNAKSFTKNDRPFYLRGVPTLFAHQTSRVYEGTDALATLEMFRKSHDLCAKPLELPPLPTSLPVIEEEVGVDNDMKEYDYKIPVLNPVKARVTKKTKSVSFVVPGESTAQTEQPLKLPISSTRPLRKPVSSPSCGPGQA